MGGGGSSSGTSIQPITTDQLKQFYGFQSGQFGKYKQDQPLLKSAETNALGFNNQLFGAGSPLQNLWSLSDAEKRNVDQSTLTGGGAGSDYGMANSKGTVASEVLGREDFMLQRAGQLQGLATGGLNQEIGVQGAETGTFSQLMNPILQVPMANLQGQIAQAQINQQSQQAGQSKAAGGISAGVSVLGSVAAAY